MRRARTVAAPALLALALLAVSSLVTVHAQEAVAATEDFTRAVFFGKKFADLGEYGSAYEQYAKADLLRPDQPAVLYNMAVVLARAGRYGEAQGKADRYLSLFPEGEEKPLVARLQLELEFQRELQKKRQADQEYADLFNRARFVYGRAELEEALRLFRQAEQVRPTDAAAVYNQALTLEKQGKIPEAIERYRRYTQLESEPERKASMAQRLLSLQREVEDMQTKIVCSFCGHKLSAEAGWCPRCWHGPYDAKSAVWNTRQCSTGASVTRALYYSGDRFGRNDLLPCLWKDGTMLDSLRYTRARQQEIRNARTAEGWTYEGDVIQGNNEVRFEQGPTHLERIASTSGGEILTYLARQGGSGNWLLDREELVIDALKFTNRYTYDARDRIAQQQVRYQNTAACNHLIDMSAAYLYEGDLLTSVTLQGGYDGFPAEGAPKAAWQATVSYAYDGQGRVAAEELRVESHTKTYQQRPHGELRDEVSRLFTGMRVRKPVENVLRVGDLCAAWGSTLLSNPIDLRPFYALSPNLAIQLPSGVQRMSVTVTY